MIYHLVGPQHGPLTECGLTTADALVAVVDEVSCVDCRTTLITKGICPECGERHLRWQTYPRNKSAAHDGRLRVSDVDTAFVLGCETCSETLTGPVSPETVAEALTEMKWHPSL